MMWRTMKQAAMVLGLALLAVSGTARAAENLETSFASPPTSARPWVYWFWLDGNITREGITADLEAMKRVGIGGVLIMEVDQGAPKGPARFGGTQWRELFKFVLSEANRLGLEVNMNNDAGWCGSGGPWITPELAQKKLVWTETAVAGGQKFEGKLAQPQTVADWYRDIAVQAFPTPAGEDVKLSDLKPTITVSGAQPALDVQKLIDGNPATQVTLPLPARNKPQYVQFEFAKAFSARAITLKLAGPANVPYHAAVQVSEDGRQFRTVREFDGRPPTTSVAFDEVSSRYLRVLFTTANAKLGNLVIGEIELTPRYRIENIDAKAAFTPAHAAPASTWAKLPEDVTVPRDRVLDLTDKLDKEGKLTWDAPAGNWTVLRIGYTVHGKDNHPAPLDGRGLECDKLTKAGADAAFAGLMAKLIADSKDLVPKTLVSTHIDSWETGSQNWSATFREEFRTRRGYDPVKFLPVMTGRVVDSLEVSERFLWDLRQTVSDLIIENYAGRFRELANKNGMRLSIEAYDGCPCDEMTYAGQADEPMAEFWSWAKYGCAYSCTEMSSAAHIYGRKILGAEAFTATNAEKWMGHPGNIKDLGDWAFCEGINRFVFHRYALQPWANRPPGMSMGPWGLHYERTQTWWEDSVAWHQYLARCQYLLQQGLFVADICCLEPEGWPMRFTPPASVRPAGSHDRGKYNFDGCTPEVLFTRMSVKDGRLVLPDGMSYRVLVLPEVQTMTPKLLKRVKELADAGATVIGSRFTKSPSLANYPACDEQVQQLADELWGKGKIIADKTPEQVLMGLGIRPDFSADVKLRYIHKKIDDTDVYFVANGNAKAVDAVCSFRMSGRRPEIWEPDTGRTAKLAVFDELDGCTRIPLRLEASGSLFIVFRGEPARPAEHIVSVTRNGQELFKEREGTQSPARDVVNTFTMVAWVKPAADSPLPKEINTGNSFYTPARNDMLFPPPGHEVWSEGEAGAGFAVGRNGVVVDEHGANYFPALLVHPAALTDWTHVAIVYQDGVPSLYLNGQFARKGLKGTQKVHAGVGVSHGRNVAPFQGEVAGLQQFERAMNADEIAKLAAAPRPAVEREKPPAVDFARGEIWEPGTYVLKTGDGQSRQVAVSNLPEAVEIAGPWELSFPPNLGAPASVTLDKLMSWSEHTDPGVRYFSGTATYSKRFTLSPDMLGKDNRAYLDLGNVQVMAEVKLNGKDLGILWKAPYRVDVTEALKAGENALQVRVVNLWINRQIGDEQLPDDSERNPNGTLKEWPQWLQDSKPSSTGRVAFTSWRLWSKTDPLVESGLIGPVTLRMARTWK